MATSTVLSGLELTKWQRNYILDYVRDSGFKPYMGTSEMDIICVKNDLKTDGYTIRIPLALNPEGAGVSGNTTLNGTEEASDDYYQDITWEFYRHAMQTTKKEKHKSAPDLLGSFRPRLRNWASELVKYQIIDNFHSIDGTNYSAASEANKDTWLTNNADRVLFGSSIANNASNDHSAALANDRQHQRQADRRNASPHEAHCPQGISAYQAVQDRHAGA